MEKENGKNEIKEENESEEESNISCSTRIGNAKRIFIFFLLNLVFVTIGTFSFHALEGPNEDKICAESRAALKEFTDTLVKEPDGSYKVTDEQLLNLVKSAEEFAEEGVPISTLIDPKNDCPKLWTYGGAAYFCGTIVTTVGYGDTAPKTSEGRMLFLFYVIPGIAICGALLGEIGLLMSNMSSRIRKRFKSIPAALFWTLNGLFGVGILIFIPSLIIYLSVEEWNYFESLYFMMVTFTTVGFGDLTITAYDWKYAIMFFSYLGLAWIGYIIGTITDSVRSRLAADKEDKSSENNEEIFSEF